jgi:hypothetical protein
MSWEDEVVERIHARCKLLYSGYIEKVDYNLDVAYHRATCEYNGKSTRPQLCECPVVTEKRSRNVNRPGYLDQLKEFAKHKDTDRNPKAERGAPRVKTAGRPPGDMAGFFALDELTCDIVAVVDRAMEEAGRDRTWASSSVTTVLAGLAVQVRHFIEARPDIAREIDKATARWLDSARSTLKISTSAAIFDSVACGNCGGGLGTPWGNRGEADVRCIGTPNDPPCGESYPVSEWLRLYEDHKRRQATS